MHKGIDGLFRGLGDLLQIATDLAGRTAEQNAHDGVFGVSVRVGHGPVASRSGRVHHPGRRVAHDPRGVVADVFDEDDHYVVIAELPGVPESAIEWSIQDDAVVGIRADHGGRTYDREVALAAAVDARTAVARYGNGVLEVRVWKQQPR